MRISDWSSDVCSSDLRDQRRRITGASALHPHGDVAAGHPSRRLDHLAHREALAVAEVEAARPALAGQPAQCQDVRVGPVGALDLLTDTSAVARVVSGAEHTHLAADAGGGLPPARDTVGCRTAPLAQPTAGTG